MRGLHAASLQPGRGAGHRRRGRGRCAGLAVPDVALVARLVDGSAESRQHARAAVSRLRRAGALQLQPAGREVQAAAR